jgi:hypothetical protein
MKAIRNLAILGVLGWLAWSYFVPQGMGDRPSIVIANGPVRIEVQAQRGKERGTFEQGMFGMGHGWYHHHPNRGPSKLEAIVEGSTCGENAHYEVDELRILSNGAGTSSTVVVSIGGIGPFTSLQIDPQGDTSIKPDARTPYQLLIGTSDETLTQVRVGAATCAFQSPGEGSITIVQKQ